MNTSNPTDREHQSKYAEAISGARKQGAKDFHSWFNRSASVEESVVRGFWDFALHVLTPSVSERLQKPEDMTALEIGYGGGRLLNAACSFFGKAIGIDVHGEQKEVEKFLNSQGKKNYKLIRTDGRTIPVDDGSVDFVYSFIVLQHLASFSSLEDYLMEAHRCLKAGGVAQMYVGCYARKLSLHDRVCCFTQGYKEIKDAPVNHTSLVVRVGKMAAVCRAMGFEVIGAGDSYKTVPDGYPGRIGGQSFVTIRKK